jgi:secreted trypsin-like serine protease
MMGEYDQRQSHTHTHTHTHTSTTSSLSGSNSDKDVDVDVDIDVDDHTTDNTSRILGRQLGGHDRRHKTTVTTFSQSQSSISQYQQQQNNNQQKNNHHQQFKHQQFKHQQFKHQQQRIIGGTVTQPNQYPWLAALFAAPVDFEGRIIPTILQKGAATYVCTGTLIAPSVVLSAAHCAFGEFPANYITVGKYDLSKKKTLPVSSSSTSRTSRTSSTNSNSTPADADADAEQGQSFAVQQTIVHPAYNHSHLISETNDIALFVLEGAFQVDPFSVSFQNTIHKYHLQLNADHAVPSRVSDVDVDSDSDTTNVNVNTTNNSTTSTSTNVNDNVTAIGYGVNDLVNAPTTASPVAYEVTLQTMSRQECQARYNNGNGEESNENENIDKDIDMIGESMLCASAPGKDACLGDSGGPLLMMQQRQRQSYDSNSTDNSTTGDAVHGNVQHYHQHMLLVGVVSWGK